LNVDQKTIKDLLTDKSANFLIPDYQRPYAWEEDECQTLWDDIFSFAFPDNNKDSFKANDEYFLDAIVTYKNNSGQSEVIDGQQRLTTILLLLRAFYDRFEHMADQPSKDMRKNISQCIWRTDEFGNADMANLKIDSEVATDDEKEEFLSILRRGVSSKTASSKYAKNYRFFETKINTFVDEYPSYFAYLPARILNNCILLPIEADSQDTALRIFSTLNDRGLPLADADIFKAQFYKYYEKKGTKSAFIDNWKELSSVTEKIFHPSNGTPMDELFTNICIISELLKEINPLQQKLFENSMSLIGIENYLEQHPEIDCEELHIIISALVSVLQSRNGMPLLEKLSAMDCEDMDTLNNILDKWSVFDIRMVLDGIDQRLKVISAIEQLCNDPSALLETML